MVLTPKRITGKSISYLIFEAGQLKEDAFSGT